MVEGASGSLVFLGGGFGEAASKPKVVCREVVANPTRDGVLGMDVGDMLDHAASDPLEAVGVNCHALMYAGPWLDRQSRPGSIADQARASKCKDDSASAEEDVQSAFASDWNET